MIKELTDYYSILNILENNSFQAYFVGGCVRDYLLGRKITDVDIATDAKPSQLTELFFSFPTLTYGLKYGTLAIKGELPCQITTFRSENDYRDSRHPSVVRFVKTAKSDAKRRDFTINALYLAGNGAIEDYYCGLQDLKNKVIRMIGKPEIRLQEDPLRILRALRLADSLRFSLEGQLEEQLLLNITRLQGLNKQKIKEETKKYQTKGKYYEKYSRYLTDIVQID